MGVQIYPDKPEKVKNSWQTAGIIILAFSLVVTLCLFTNDIIFGVLGSFIKSFFTGAFGVAAYALSIASIASGSMLIGGKKITASKRRVNSIAIAFLMLVFIVHMATTAKTFAESENYGAYLLNCYDMVDGITGGGVVVGLLIYPFAVMVRPVGCYVICSVILAASIMVLTDFAVVGLFVRKPRKIKSNGIPNLQDSNSCKYYYTKASTATQQVSASALNVKPVSQSITPLNANKNPNYDAARSILYGGIENGAQYPHSQPVSVNHYEHKENTHSLYNRSAEIPQNQSYTNSYERHNRQPAQPLKAVQQYPQQPAYQAVPQYVQAPQAVPQYIQNPNTVALYGQNSAAVPVQQYVPQQIQPQIIKPQTVSGQFYQSQPQPIATPENIPLRRPPIVVHNDAEKAEEVETDRTLQRRGRKIKNDFDIELERAISDVPQYESRQQSIDRQQERPLDNRPPIIVADNYQKAVNEREYRERNEQSKREALYQLKKPSQPVQEPRLLKQVEEIKMPDERQKADFSDYTEVQPVVEVQAENSIVDLNPEVEQELPTENRPIVKPLLKGVVPVDSQLSCRVDNQNKPKQVKKAVKYNAPPIELLEESKPYHGEEEDFAITKENIERVLDDFKISAKVVNIVKGPTITRYELELAPGTKISKIQSISDNIAMGIYAVDNIRIEAPIPGKNLVGIEVPNSKRAIVSLRSIIDSQEFEKSEHMLSIAVGQDIGGNKIVQDLADMPHLLVAGSTNTGKSVCLNTLIVSLMYKYSPEELRFILVDPKQVEFSSYEGMPHMLLSNRICDPEKALNAFEWLIQEMERRYTLFTNSGTINLKSYNATVAVEDKLPRIVLVVDEFSDLMHIGKAEIEQRINRLAAKSRAAGIHLVIATQRPSADVITGTIKMNLPCRIALKVASFKDSMTIFDYSGPEKLIGKGDMLLKTNNIQEAMRLQGAFISSSEVKSVVSYIKDNNEAHFDNSLEDKITKSNQFDGSMVESGNNALLQDVIKHVINNGTASISMIQRGFSVGYARAGKIMDEMEKMGIVTGFDGSKSRQVKITMEDYYQMFGIPNDKFN